MMRLILAALAFAATPALADWQATLDAARGQTVYVNAWGGDPRTNAFLEGVGAEVLERYGVTLTHVKLTDTAEAVNRVVAEKEAGKAEGGTVDMIWINGPNFASMKEAGLLHGPFVADLPNAAYLDLTPGAPATLDFTVPVEGYESPWRLARFVFAHDGATGVPPATMAAMVDWAAAHPGRLTHPDPSNFIGATFLKQAMIELAPDPSALQSPVTEEAFAEQTDALWAWYDALRPNLWRGGETYPENETAQAQLMNDGEVAIAMFFDPAAPAALIEQGLLPETARVFVPEGGSIGNISFLAIPFNAQAREGAMVVANHLLDPAVQARQQDITVLGSFSVLDPAKLPAEAAAAFAALPTHPALPTLEALGPTLAEPHGSWMTRLTEEWSRRYVK
jgi:putative thiamine transport system substrate-binding protein